MVAIPTQVRVGDMPSNTPIPEALYQLRVDKVELDRSSTKGELMAVCQLTVFGPPEAEEFHGRKVFLNLMLEGKGAFLTRQLLEANGFDENFSLTDTEQLLNLEALAAVEIEPERANPTDPNKPYQARNKVSRFMPIE